MKAVIFEVGFGRRLSPLTNKISKSMVEVNGRSLYGNVLNNLLELCSTDTDMVGGQLIYFENNRQPGTNNVVSFYRTFDFCNDDMIMLECDIYYHKEMILYYEASLGLCAQGGGVI